MKNFLTIASVFLLTFFSFNSFATTYYLSSSSGSDNNSGTDASSPWRSIDKLNSFYNLRSGDNVLFKRGDTFYGGIQVNNSGSSGNPITYGAYGSGAKPIITGFTNITSWNNLGSNIWESSDAVSSLSYTNMVSVNGINTPMGRYPNTTGPNTGYLYIQSHSGNSSLTASGGLGSNNWTGAGIVIRKEKYVIERGKITSQSGSTLYYNGASQYNTQDDFGFFVQNDPKTLDVNGEWYYNPSTNKLRIYSSSRPSDVRIATVENLVSSSSKSNITFDNITFTGSNSDAISCLNSGNNLTVQNCDITLTGMSAIWTVIQNSIIQNNNISDVNYIGVYSSADNAVIKNNSFNNINLFEGADQIIASGGVISTYGQNTVVQYNQINNCGYSGIKLGGLNTRVSNNLVNRFCLIKEDGGGIDMSARDRARGSVIDGNIVLNGIGSSNGTSDINSHDFGGIFIDAYGTGVTITNNSVANVATAGIKLHGSNNIIIKNNTTFNNGGSSWTKGGIMLLSVDAYPIYNLTIEGNIFVARNPDQLAFFGYPAMQSFGTSNNNYFAKPIDESTAIKAYSNVYNLAGWKSYSGEDGSSKGSPKTISNVNDLRFEYNATSSSKTIQLDANYIDVKNNSYNGSITLAPYTSAVLIRNGDRSGNNPPTADAGSDRIIQLPSNSVVLPGSGSDADGSVVSYSWSQVSGPSTATMVNPSSAQAGAGNLIEGAYVFQLTVTDNQGATGTSKVTITVKSTESLSGSNVPPMAIVGDDRTIQLPKKSVVLPGSGSDADGSVVSYSWSQVSGPSTATLVNTSSAQGGAGDLVEGVYQFQLQVTDNQGATGTSVLKVSVESGTSGSNIRPIANVGADRVIDLPKNSIVLPGSGSDADGSVVSYSWSQVSGPSTATLFNTSSAQGGAGDLVEGVYQFQLQVTDNQGATGTSVLKVTVESGTSGSNIRPIANVGADRVIDLPKNSIVLPGSGSDADGSVVSYSWSQVSGPSTATLINTSSAQGGAGNLVEGVYQFQLQVTDNQGATGTSVLKVTVESGTSGSNIKPIANVGDDRVIDFPKKSIVLPGSGSDADGSVVSYSWSQVSGPSTATLINTSSAQAGASNLVVGVYQFQLQVTDNQGATGTAVLKVTVNSENPNVPPVANVGTNRQIYLPKNSIVLPGSGSDADGSVVSYSWSQVSGPSNAIMVNPSSAQAGAGDLNEGKYVFQLTVTDDQGATGTANLEVTVNSNNPNIPPVASVGTNRQIDLPKNSIVLPGSGSDIDGSVVSYAWSEMSGPSTATMVNPSSAEAGAGNLKEGTYVFQLTVTDDQGATGTANLTVVVNSGSPNIPPVANVGTNRQIDLPKNSIVLPGSGSDADGSIVSYSWSQVSGPSTATMVNPSSAQSGAGDLKAGNYQFQLTVTDNQGATGSATLIVTVNSGTTQARIANLSDSSTTKLQATSLASTETTPQPESEMGASFKNSLKIYPNPAEDFVNVEIYSTNNSSKETLIILDMSGRIVYRNEFTSSAYNYKKQIDISRLKKGNYIISVNFNGSDIQTSKLIKL